jgi:hypothetical protein
MPTIELVSIGCRERVFLPAFRSFALLVSSEPRSHRGLFEETYDALDGMMVHLSNANCERDGIWFASDLIETDASTSIPEVDPDDPDDSWGAGQTATFRFQPHVRPELESLIRILLDSSPVRRITIATDYQFGPAEPSHVDLEDIDSFWQLHDIASLRLNTLYGIG